MIDREVFYVVCDHAIEPSRPIATRDGDLAAPPQVVNSTSFRDGCEFCADVAKSQRRFRAAILAPDRTIGGELVRQRALRFRGDSIHSSSIIAKRHAIQRRRPNAVCPPFLVCWKPIYGQ